MSGQSNLNEVLKSLQVSCDDVEYGFANVNNEEFIPSDEIIGTFQEKEGRTLIATKGYFEQKGVSYDGPFAKLTIEIHTSLNLVGLTAAIATTLAQNGISANVVAAFFHDHIFVQYALREKAISALLQLKESEK